jgi:hypothetical protein
VFDIFTTSIRTYVTHQHPSQVLIDHEEPALEHSNSRDLPSAADQDAQNTELQWQTYHVARSYDEFKNMADACGDAGRGQRAPAGAMLRVDAAALSLNGLHTILSGLGASLGGLDPSLHASLSSLSASLTGFGASLGGADGGGAARARSGLKLEDVRVGQLVCVASGSGRWVLPAFRSSVCNFRSLCAIWALLCAHVYAFWAGVIIVRTRIDASFFKKREIHAHMHVTYAHTRGSEIESLQGRCGQILSIDKEAKSVLLQFTDPLETHNTTTHAVPLSAVARSDRAVASTLGHALSLRGEELHACFARLQACMAARRASRGLFQMVAHASEVRGWVPGVHAKEVCRVVARCLREKGAVLKGMMRAFSFDAATAPNVTGYANILQCAHVCCFPRATWRDCDSSV